VWRDAELTGLYTVRPDGKISMPLAGEIVASGMTPDQFKENVVRALGEFMNRPEVMVEVSRVNSKKFFVSGEVNRPGSYAMVTPLTVLEALSNAGGLREFANRKKIVVMRGEDRGPGSCRSAGGAGARAGGRHHGGAEVFPGGAQEAHGGGPGGGERNGHYRRQDQAAGAGRVAGAEPGVEKRPASFPSARDCGAGLRPGESRNRNPRPPFAKWHNFATIRRGTEGA
jgi:hypothetical protein